MTNVLQVRFRCIKCPYEGICSVRETGRGHPGVRQTLYWTERGTLACGGCGVQATGDGKLVPYVIEHEADCEAFPDNSLRCAVLPERE